MGPKEYFVLLSVLGYNVVACKGLMQRASTVGCQDLDNRETAAGEFPDPGIRARSCSSALGVWMRHASLRYRRTGAVWQLTSKMPACRVSLPGPGGTELELVGRLAVIGMANSDVESGL